MKEKDKKLIKKAALVMADQIASRIPAFNIAWGLSKALIGASMELRQQRVLEWVEMVKDNPSFFTEQILKDEKFQDGFVFALEKYIREKNMRKKEIMKKIFLGFTEDNNKEEFELEKMYHVLSILNPDDLLVLREIYKHGKFNMNDSFQSVDKIDEVENVYNLINVGIFMPEYSKRIGPDVPFVKVADFGKSFVKFIQD